MVKKDFTTKIITYLIFRKHANIIQQSKINSIYLQDLFIIHLAHLYLFITHQQFFGISKKSIKCQCYRNIRSKNKKLNV